MQWTMSGNNSLEIICGSRQGRINLSLRYVQLSVSIGPTLEDSYVFFFSKPGNGQVE